MTLAPAIADDGCGLNAVGLTGSRGRTGETCVRMTAGYHVNLTLCYPLSLRGNGLATVRPTCRLPRRGCGPNGRCVKCTKVPATLGHDRQ
jgi:hypothetical protein